MKFEFFSQSFVEVKNVVKRFLLPTVLAVLMTFLAIVLEFNDWWVWSMNGNVFARFFLRTFFSGVIGFFVLIALKLFTESRKIKTVFGQVVGVFLILALWWYFGSFQFDFGEAAFGLRWLLLLGASFLMVLVAPYTQRSQKKVEEYFWTFVYDVVRGVLLAFLYFVLLYLGLSMVYASVDYLFAVDVSYRVYLYTWFLVMGLGVSTFFMVSIPEKFSRFSDKSAFSRGVGFLTKFIAVPLVLIYLVVLYVYAGGIVFAGDWPEGGVASWIVVFSAVGVLTYFLARFIQDRDKAYIGWFCRYFFWLLIPLVVMLFLALEVRVSDYGMTVMRYFGFALGDFFLLSSLYFIFSKSRGVRVLFGLMIVMLLVSAVGPYSAVEWSYDSQVRRIERLSSGNDRALLPDHDFDVNPENKRQISAAVDYVVANLGLRDRLVLRFGEDFVASNSSYDRGYYDNYGVGPEGAEIAPPSQNLGFARLLRTSDGLDISAYEMMFGFEGLDGLKELVELSDFEFSVAVDDGGVIDFDIGDEVITWRFVEILEERFGEDLYVRIVDFDVNDQLVFTFEDEKRRFMLILNEFDIERLKVSEKSYSHAVFNLSGYLFFALK